MLNLSWIQHFNFNFSKTPLIYMMKKLTYNTIKYDSDIRKNWGIHVNRESLTNKQKITWILQNIGLNPNKLGVR